MPGRELRTIGGANSDVYNLYGRPLPTQVGLHGKDISYSHEGIHFSNLSRCRNIVIALCEPDTSSLLGVDPSFSQEKVLQTIVLPNGVSNFKPLPPAQYTVTVSQKFVGQPGATQSVTAKGIELCELIGTTVEIVPSVIQGEVTLKVGNANTKDNFIRFKNPGRYEHTATIARPSLSRSESLLLQRQKMQGIGSNEPDGGGIIMEQITIAPKSEAFSSCIHRFYDVYALETEQQMDSGSVGNFYAGLTGHVPTKNRYVVRAYTRCELAQVVTLLNNDPGVQGLKFQVDRYDNCQFVDENIVVNQ